MKLLSCVQFFATPWTIAYQDRLSTGFFRQEYWSGLLFPSLGDLPVPGIKTEFPHCTQTLYPLSHQGRPIPSRTNTKKSLFSIIGDWNAKVGSQEIPGVTGKFGLGNENESKAKAREHIGHHKHPLPTAQEMSLHIDITRWSILK